MKYTRIVNGYATDTVSQDPSELFHPTLSAEFVECPDGVENGWRWADDVWSDPVAVAPTVTPSEQVPADQSTAPAMSRQISRAAFLRRFSDQEAISIDLASIGATVEAAGIRRYLSLVNAAAYVDLDDPATRAGVQTLEAVQLIEAGRAAEILDAPVAPAERP